jgi:hypothetical protein
LHGDAVGVTLSLAATDAVTLADADDEAVGDAVTDEDAATLGEADTELNTHKHVYLHRRGSGRAAAARWAAAAEGGGHAERSTRSPLTHWSGCGGEHC